MSLSIYVTVRYTCTRTVVRCRFLRAKRCQQLWTQEKCVWGAKVGKTKLSERPKHKKYTLSHAKKNTLSQSEH